MAGKLYTIKHGRNYTGTGKTYRQYLDIVNKETLLHIAKMLDVKNVAKSHSKDMMTEAISSYVLAHPEACLSLLSYKELKVLKDFAEVGANTPVVRPCRKYYNTLKELLFVSVFHDKKERSLYFLMPDVLRESFAPFLDKLMKEAKKREKAQKEAAPRKPAVAIEEPEYLDDDEFSDDDDEEEFFNNFETFLQNLGQSAFIADLSQKASALSAGNELNSPTFKYSCSVDLMETIRNLPFEKQMEVCKTFLRMIEKGQMGPDTIFFDRFEEDFETVDSEDDETWHNLHFCINDLDNAITEIDYNYPTMFFKVAGELDKVISAE